MAGTFVIVFTADVPCTGWHLSVGVGPVLGIGQLWPGTRSASVPQPGPLTDEPPLPRSADTRLRQGRRQLEVGFIRHPDLRFPEAMTTATLLSFAGACSRSCPDPTPGAALQHRRYPAGRHGRRRLTLGGLIWAAVVALGVATLLAQSASAYRVLKIAGGL